MDLYSPAMEPIVFASENPSKKDHIFTVLVITYSLRSMPIDFGNVGKIRNASRSRAAEDKPFSEVASWATEKLVTPPDVGAADASSAMLMPTRRTPILATAQPQTIAAGPPFGRA